MNALSMLWSGSNTILWCASLQIDGKKFSRKMENTKVTGTGLQNASKDTSESWDIERSLWYRGSAEGCPVAQKMRGNYLSFWP